jgi:hypothetical protein
MPREQPFINLLGGHRIASTMAVEKAVDDWHQRHVTNWQAVGSSSAAC